MFNEDKRKGAFILKVVGHMHCWGSFTSHKVSGKIWSQMKHSNTNPMLSHVNVHKPAMESPSWVPTS